MMIFCASHESWENRGSVQGNKNEQPQASISLDAFLMDVTETRGDWPESLERERIWLSPTTAVARVDYLGLRKLLRKVFSASGSRPASKYN